MLMTTIADLTHDPKNARKHGKRNLDTIAKSLEECGAARSIVIDENGVILAGNGLVEAAGQLGIENVQIVQADGNTIIAVQRTGLTAKQKKRLALFDNRSAELAEWDAGAIAELVSEDFDFKDLFSTDELDAILAELMEPDGGLLATADPDAIPENVETRCKQGDLWQLGRHRLLCGDSTNSQHIERLMNGELADMVFTDPPYGVSYDGGMNKKKREKLSGDDSGDLYYDCLTVAVAFIKSSAPLYVWFASSVGKPVYDTVNAIGYKIRAMIVWNKTDAHYGNFMAQYMQKHEPCLYCVKDSPAWYGATNEVTVWDIKQPSVNEFHPTQKPTELAVRAMLNSTKQDDIIADFFLGSGTTLIAAEQENRVCYGLEIEPKYCDVILTRWENATGKTATLITE